jgi:hypothetical protein
MKTNETRTDYRATPEQWESIERYADSISYSCILELRARIEALDTAQQPRPKPPSLKEQALEALDMHFAAIGEGQCYQAAHKDTIRRALEALPE